MFKSLWSGATVAMLMGLAAQAEPVPAGGTAAGSAQAAAPTTRVGQGALTPGGGVIVITNPQAVACQNAAKFGDVDGAGVEQCALALGSPLLSQRDLAALYTDRGAVYLQHRQYDQAKADLDAALKLDASVADAYVDRGAALLGLKQYAEAIADIDRGLALGPDQPERAYFNRAIADEQLKDEKSARDDYLKASQLNPGWQAPKDELDRLSH